MLPILTIMATMESYYARDARLKMREILTATEHGEHVGIKRYDTPTAVVVSHDWWMYATDALAIINTAINRGAFTAGDLTYLREARASLGLTPQDRALSGDDRDTSKEPNR
jgi:antitoxin (DNA-binding transcriptional repressor) of toxin-antitoxin stability system